MATKRELLVPIAPVKKKSAIELMLDSGEIIDMYKQRPEIQRLTEHLCFHSGETFRTSRNLTPLEEIQALQETVDTQMAKQSFLPFGTSQFLKRDSRIHKDLVAKLTEFGDEMD
jgi:hypothetical protein